MNVFAAGRDICEGRLLQKVLQWPTQLLFQQFAKRKVGLGHLRWNLAVPEERQYPLQPSGALYGRISFCALRGRACARCICQLSGSLGFRAQHCKQTGAVDIDDFEQTVELTH
jgi:hypothetical protein